MRGETIHLEGRNDPPWRCETTHPGGTKRPTLGAKRPTLGAERHGAKGKRGETTQTLYNREIIGLIAINVMLVTVSVVFVLLTMPNCIFFIVKDDWNYRVSLHETARYYLVFQVVFLLSDLNHAINFYLYFLSGKKFRRHFNALICCKKKKQPLRTQSTMITRSVRNTNYSISSSANSLVLNPSPSGERISSAGLNGYQNGDGRHGNMKNDTTHDTSLNGSTISLGDIKFGESSENGIATVSNSYKC
ncbi:hypothetical protein FSP39_008047 [Pinctada imbricata]|uniref:G-protein coupled receptors family 1 profile domain-containing protein n=1 Tax=Pinctada imbricata TaxID=66713 RepID=A0AA89CCK7_PINIB|nr:hypothetical protein FSP39_008047 [Pinctada imbricata]